MRFRFRIRHVGRGIVILGYFRCMDSQGNIFEYNLMKKVFISEVANW